VLEAIGVRRLEARIYAELVGADQPSIGDIAARCGVSTRIAAAELTRLASLGLAFRLAGRPVRYRAIAPDLALNALISQREEELRQVRAVMHQLTATFQERTRHPGSRVEVVHGTANIARIAARVAEQTRYEMRGLDRPPYSEVGTKNALERERRRIQNGVSYRVIYDQAALAVPGRMAHDILLSCADGEQARTRPELPIKLIISDDQLALIPAAVTSHSIDTTFVIHRSPILTALIALFEAEWARAIPIGPHIPAASDAARDAAEAAPVAPPDEETSALLGLLAAGLTDASIARSLSWSVRTTQRRVQQLMSDLGATTRFQAGMAARERGWL
jgi:transcriptional regulator TrmB